MTVYILVFAGALVMAIGATPAARWLAPRAGFIDHPDARRIHKRPVPRLGGVAIYVAVIVAALILGDQFNFDEFGVILIGATGISFMGLIDDRWGLRPMVKLVGQILAAWEDFQERGRREQAAAAEAKRVAKLEALAGREEETWDEVEALIQQSQAKPYDQAVNLLLQLSDLAEYQDREAAFGDRLASLCDRYRRRYALMGRLREAGLIEG